jgi:hypothetical protein
MQYNGGSLGLPFFALGSSQFWSTDYNENIKGKGVTL